MTSIQAIGQPETKKFSLSGEIKFYLKWILILFLIFDYLAVRSDAQNDELKNRVLMLEKKLEIEYKKKDLYLMKAENLEADIIAEKNDSNLESINKNLNNVRILKDKIINGTN